MFPTRGKKGVTRLTLALRWVEAGAAVPGCPGGAVAVFLKVGRVALGGGGGFSRTPGWALALRRRQGALTELPHQTRAATTRGRTWPWSD